MEWINAPITQGGAVALLVGVFIMVMTGRLIPRWVVDRWREQDRLTIERQQSEIKEWRTAWIAENLTKRELALHVGELMESGKVTQELIKGMRDGPP